MEDDPARFEDDDGDEEGGEEGGAVAAGINGAAAR